MTSNNENRASLDDISVEGVRVQAMFKAEAVRRNAGIQGWIKPGPANLSEVGVTSDIRTTAAEVTINSEENGEGVVVVLDLEHPVGVPEKAKDVHATSVIR